MEEENKNSNESQKNITGKWLDTVFESLQRLEQHERLATDGCLTILEYANLNPGQLPPIQLKNLGMMFGEFDRLFENTREIIPKDKYDAMMLQLKLYGAWFHFGKGTGEGKEKVSRVLRNDAEHISHVELLPLFWNVQRGLSKLRGLLVSNLAHILYSLDKFKDKKRRET